MAGKIILVTGANGQLGKEFAELSQQYPNHQFIFASRSDLPIEDSNAVNSYFSQHTINCCINCAAYTAVDKAETEKEQAFSVNAAAAGNLAAVCKTHDAAFIHISTDYVFDGNGTRPYKETDEVNPMSVYGQSKLKGEQLVMANNPAAIIIMGVLAVWK
jgi:dTDP-4-dehydrorhamnose reductase